MAFDAEIKSPLNGDGEVKIAPTQDQAKAGFVAMGVEQGAATEPSGARKVRRLKASLNRRLAVGLDTVLMAENFNATAQNTGLWKSGATTFTRAQASGFVVFNNALITTINASQYEATYQHFPLGGPKPTQVDFPFIVTAAIPSGWQEDVGQFAQSGVAPYTPVDGVYLRFNSTGLFAVLNNAGVETVSGLLLAAGSIAPNVSYTARLIVANERTEVWINDPSGGLGTPDAASFAYLGAVDTPPANPYPCSSLALPFAARLVHLSAAGAGVAFKLGGPTITEGDVGSNRDHHEMRARSLGHGSQGQNGGVMGSTALFTNSLAPGAGAAMTNTTAALGSGAGGQFTTTGTLAANTDGIVCSYQNPLPTLTAQGRTLLCKGVRVQFLVTAAITGGPLAFVYSLAYGHTAVSLATAEAVAAKAPRRIPIGVEVVPATAPVYTAGPGIYLPLSGVPINPGEFIALAAKNVGVAASAGAITFIVTFDLVPE